ncbi:hypothetical protein HZS_1311 [Henneguya salminicola]|nr:hypothetical protein HZS_1311 [Henneguya salminicola]
MSINVYESGNPVQSSNNTSNLLFADQFVDRTQISSCGMNGTDSDFHENQNISFNFPVSQVTQQAQIPQNIAYFNRIPDINEGNGDSINIIGENNIIRQNTNGFNYDPFIINSQMTYNQPYTRFNIAQNNFNDDTNNMTLGGNIILAFPSQQNDNINTMQNIIALPTNNGNSFDYLGSMISNTAWISNASQTVQTIDPRHMYNGRQIERSRHNQTTSNGDSRFGKPVFSYSCLIALALRHSELGSLPVNEIYKYMQDNFPYFKNAPDGWKNSVRHNLSLNKAFQKTVRNDTTSTQRKGCLWTLKPEKKRIIEKEIRKWFKKHPEAIRRSMSNPGKFYIFFS